MAFVESPGMLNREPHEVHFVEDDPEGADGSLEDGDVGEVEGEALLFEKLAAFAGFLTSSIGEVDVGPAGEPVFLVPDAFSVTNQH